MTTLFIHDRNTTTVHIASGGSYRVPDGYIGTLRGRPCAVVHAGEPELDVYIRRIGVGGMPKKGSKPPKIKGKGSYKQVAKKAVAAVNSQQAGKIAAKIGQSIGTALGSKIGMGKEGGAAGAMLATKAHTVIGKKLQKLIGRGDYSLEGSQTSVNSLIKGNPSAYSSFGDNHAETVVEYREYIGDLATGTVTPQTAGTLLGSDTNLFYQTFNVNPGDPTVFPWFNKIATRYEEYRFDGLIFEYVSTTSPYNTNSAMGEVIITSQDNVTATELTTRQSMFNTEMCCTGRLDRNIMYGVECAQQAQKWYYVKGNASAATPANLQDFVKVYFASQVAATFPSDSVLGEIWVTYRVRLRGPVMLDGVDTTITISTSTTVPLPGDLPSLPITIGSANVYATGAYTTLTGSTKLAFTSLLDTNANLVSNSGFAKAAQLNFTKLRTGEVFTITATFQNAINYGGLISLFPPSLTFPVASMQLYSPAVSSAIGGGMSAPSYNAVNPFVYLDTAPLSTNDLGIPVNRVSAQTYQTLPMNPSGSGLVANANNVTYTWTLQYIGSSSAAAKPVATYTFGLGTAPFYPSSILIGWGTSASVDSLSFPISSYTDSGAKSFGASQWTMNMKSLGIFDIAAESVSGTFASSATPAFFQLGASLAKTIGSTASII